MILLESTSLLESGLLITPTISLSNTIPISNEVAIDDRKANNEFHGHKGIMYSPLAQRTVATVLTGGPYVGTVDYVPPFSLGSVARMLVLLVRSPIAIEVVDPAGQQIGYDTTTGGSLTDTPHAFYTGYGDDQFMLLYNPLPGDYNLTFTGMDDGYYEVESYLIDEGGVRVMNVMTGTVTAGQTLTESLTYTQPSTTLFSDDMETGGSNWLAEGSWQLDTSTAHSPITGWDSGLVTTTQPLTLTLLPTLDLSTANLANLTFWHTYALTQNARWQVELSADGGQTWQLLAEQQEGNWDWSATTLNLTPFTGSGYEAVQLRFRLPPTSVGSRWRIDDVQVDKIDPPALFWTPFQDDVEGWQKWLPTGDWQVVTDTVHSPQHSWQATTDSSQLTLINPLYLESEDQLALTFWHRLEGATAQGIAQASTDGTTWQTVATLSETASTWQSFTLDLREYEGQLVHLRFQLNAPEGGTWWLDDIATSPTLTGLHTLPFTDNMTPPQANWASLGSWQPVSDSVHSGDYAWHGTAGRLQLVDQLDLTTAVSPTLTFWQQLNLPSNQLAQVQVRPTGVITWQPVLTMTGPISTWMPIEVDLTPFAGQTIQLSLAITPVSTSNPTTNNIGVSLALISLPLGMMAMASWGQKQGYRRWLMRLLKLSGLVFLLWFLLYGCGYWVYVPPLRHARIDHLDVVEGADVEVFISSGDGSGLIEVSPGGSWMIAHWDGDQRLINLTTGEEQIIEIESDAGIRWLNDELFAIQEDGDLFLLTVPDFPRMRIPIMSAPDGHLYATHASGFLQIRTADTHELIARVQKRNFSPHFLGWSADSRSYYFQEMLSGAGTAIFVLHLPDDVSPLPDASLPTPFLTHNRMLINYANTSLPGRYID